MTQSIGSSGAYRPISIIDISQPEVDANHIIDTGKSNVVEPQPEQNAGLVTDGMLEQLNRLLGRAAKGSFESVRPKTLDGILTQKSMKPVMARTQGGAKAVKALASQAAELMKQLDGLQGMDDYDALFGDKKPGNGVPPLHIQAMNAQFDLSDTLRTILNRMDGTELPEKQYAMLQEMQLQCDRRAAEISRWADQMQTLYNERKQVAANPQQRAVARSVDGFSFGTPVGKALAELSGKMHGTLDGLVKLASSNKQVFDFLQTLDAYRKSGDNGEVSSEEYRKLERDAQALQQALVEIAEKGIVDDEPEARLDLNDDGRGEIVLGEAGSWRLDSATMRELAANVGLSLNGDLQRHGALIGLSQRIISSELGLPDLFRALKFVPADVLNKYTVTQNVFTPLFLAEKTVARALADYVRNPTPEQKQKMHKTIDRVTSDLMFDSLHGAGKAVIRNAMEIFAEASDAYKANPQLLLPMQQALEPLLKDSDKSLMLLQDNGDFYKKKINTVMEFLENLMQGGDLKGLKTKSFIEGVFHGQYPVSSLVETRLHGVEDEDIQTDAVDANLESSKPLGEGAANEVVLCTYSNGSKYVFKPELPGEWGLHNLNLGMGKAYSQKARVYKQNIASRRCAEAFGLENSMVTSKAGVMKGQFGFFMSVAPGKTLHALTKEPAKTNMVAVINSKSEKRQIQKNLVFQFNELQWLDLLTGQGDRHDGNLMMEISGDPADPAVSLKGIDNDMCFSNTRIGAQKYILTNGQYKYMQELTKEQKKNFPRETVAAGKRDLAECVRKQPDGTWLLDVGKIQEKNNPYLMLCARQTVGFQSSAMPSYITRALYDKLQFYKNNPAERHALIDGQLGKYLSAEARDAMARRLDELTTHAEKLHEDRKVIDPDDDGWMQVIEDCRQRHEQQRADMDRQCLKNDQDIYSQCKFTMATDYYFKFIVDEELEPRTDLP